MLTLKKIWAESFSKKKACILVQQKLYEYLNRKKKKCKILQNSILILEVIFFKQI